ncbi:MAG: FAD-binding oxidoreductase [Promethearchaeota archaeon]|nr:MAG: FAD-binding oxidoreductase [Candidatus Lokiarchaeota archaeon]
MIEPSIKKKIEKIIGERYISDDPVELYCYSHDLVSRALSWIDNNYRIMADIIIKPENADQVNEIIDLANQEHLKIIPRGAGTSYGGQFLPIEGGVVLDFSRMNNIIKIDTVDNFAVVQPGVLYKDLGKILKNTGRGFWIPCNPGSADVCTIGGMIANDASGESAIKYGTTKDYVLNLKAILGNGLKIKLGRQVKKTVAGLDLLSLFVGSEGTLGVVTEATLEFLARPESFLTIIGFFDSIEVAVQIAKEVKEYITPMSIEMVDQLVISGMNSYLSRLTPKITLKVAKAALLIRLDGEEKATSNYAEYIKNILSANQHASDIKILRGIEHEYIWKARDGAGPSLLRLTRPSKHATSMIPAILDFSVPYSKIYTLMQKFGEIMSSHNLVFTRMGHLGDGNVHLISSITLKSKADIWKMGDLQEELVKLATSLGGSVTAEHGCGIWKAPYLPMEYGEDVVELMRKIKSIFDPNNILNPGKMYSINRLAVFSK